MSANPTPAVEPRPYRMRNEIQHYDWGKRDAEAFIAQLLGIPAQPGMPYAELWMGAHPKAPSQVIVNGAPVALDRWIAARPRELLGPAVAERFNNTLPFLLKVLSAGEALSIQAHPNKAQARVLHANDPAHYPDDNHKPEVAVAIESLTALMGIKPFGELVEVLQRYPEIAGFIGPDIAGRFTQAHAPAAGEQQDLTRMALAALFTRAGTHPRELEQAIDALAQRLGRGAGSPSEAEALFLALRQQYAGPDVGLLAIFVLNLVHLRAGQGMYAEAGVPHAYLRGNIIECMANSDNVVRAGLTPKFKDAKALIEIMRYEPGPVAVLGGTAEDEVITYRTPAPEFRVSRYRLAASAQRREQTGGRPQVLIVTQGEITLRWEGGRETTPRGQSVFIPALLPEYTLAADQPAEVFKAEVPIEHA